MRGDELKRSSAGSDLEPPSGANFRTPTIQLPKGGGAIRGIGEKFAANPVTGTGSMSVPIATSPGRAGFGPQLSLTYDSGAGNGPFGFGWSLSLPSITRKTDKGLPQYLDAQESDVFVLSGAEDLVPVLVQDTHGKWAREKLPVRTVDGATYQVDRYRPRTEGLFARIERWTNTSEAADVFWRSISKDNITTWYGKASESRIADPTDPSRIFSWLICQSHDDEGNVIVYGHKAEDSVSVFEDSLGNTLTKAHERNRSDQSRAAQHYVKRIRYGTRSPYFPELSSNAAWPDPPDASKPDGSDAWHFEVVFDYGEHKTNAPGPGGFGSPGSPKGSSSATTDGGVTWSNANEIGLFINRFRFFDNPVFLGFASGDTVYEYTSEPVSVVDGDVRAPVDPARLVLPEVQLTGTIGAVSIPMQIPRGTKRLSLLVWDRFGDKSAACSMKFIRRRENVSFSGTRTVRASGTSLSECCRVALLKPIGRLRVRRTALVRRAICKPATGCVVRLRHGDSTTRPARRVRSRASHGRFHGAQSHRQVATVRGSLGAHPAIRDVRRDRSHRG